MQQHSDILDERDPMALPFIGSLLVHGCVVAVMFLGWFWMNQKGEALGDPNPAGGPAYAVSVAKTIPIPQRQAPPNPVAHDTDSLVPTAPPEKEKEVEKKLPEPPKDAFQIPDKLKPQKEQPKPKQNYTVPAPPNQVYSQSKQAMSNPMYGAQSGGARVGVNPNSPLGSHYGYYANLISQRLSDNWQTNGLSARMQTQPAIVDFHILNGKIQDAKIVQSSGNPEIDNTALRAVYASDPLTPYPPQLAGNNILAEFLFDIRDIR
jgi:TonB family protein